jgi:hypothetical protein
MVARGRADQREAAGGSQGARQGGAGRTGLNQVRIPTVVSSGSHTELLVRKIKVLSHEMDLGFEDMHGQF